MSVRIRASGNGFEWGATCILQASFPNVSSVSRDHSSSDLPSVWRSEEMSRVLCVSFLGLVSHQQRRNAVSEC